MYIEFCKSEDKLIIKLTGELDHHSAEEVRNKIDDRLERTGYNKVILDFSNVNFMDSSGIGVVIGRYKKISMRKGQICIANVQESVKRVFELSGMFKIIKLYKSVQEAIEVI
ncbi:anti-sigma F factor antagonist [Clostridium pasteurianum DSM 525 = ATCC 6013]|uniref:Anti-sigma F factor antagonist n=1 Tax=Clostridium pasteurianum DSM 525 = ATCC 6013 TaxID=1262449 RepID=A0A0H3J2W0_CLOPA|nr:anti-sigma F factor antagonist [Clostridium pasteurianum]AJA47794.1 anti-sigma F factor antagonist [Clostridium pasteurianum DSM 525 = ATCC 6013]AJA51782.1 anti-sigma F factor antagonist [Clostridium pasteurianum DSM 525 = ATCC 6013]AOZ75089.1 anti-anti-sigma factor [Clostridium pasteurianum DSM 525 = ATCC 6013]AOZ78884.1 anti-anti-sigma factor [Clostridium pasteurianum]ELP59695.1 anti-sigma F factor antagonist [Clostridium pasteurianum DSM 525 = ATCC 6013]